MGPMNPSIHKLSGPYLLQVKASKLNAKRLEVDALRNRLRRALEEVAAMESDPDWVQFVELAAEQMKLAPPAPFQRALPVLLSQQPGAPLTEFVVEVFNTACEWVPIPGCTFTTKEQALAEMQGRERNHGSRDMKVSEVGPFGKRTVATGLNGYTMRFRSVMRCE